MSLVIFIVRCLFFFCHKSNHKIEDDNTLFSGLKPFSIVMQLAQKSNDLSQSQVR